MGLVNTFEKVNSIKVPYQFAARRDSDIAAYYADVSLAKKLLHWEAQHKLEDICIDSWRWQSQNPKGY